MSDPLSQASDLVSVIVGELVEFPDDLEVTASESDEGTVFVEIRVHPDDAGKIIGRQGRVIKAIRTLVRAAASGEGTPIEVEIID